MTALFKLSNVSKIYGTREVLKIKHLEITPGQVYSILGPNGSGKTTLLRTMSLLTVNNTGQLKVFGETINWSPSQLLRLRRQMAMVTQSSFMFEGSVYYNVAYGLRVRKTPERMVKRKVQESLELMGMSKFMDYPARNLSGGEKQKVAIARAIAIKPKVLFLDEPTSSIDPSSSVEIEHYIKQINETGTTTIIMITHNLFQARRLTDYTFFLWEGKIIEEGITPDLFQFQKDVRTRKFFCGEY